MAHCDAAYRHQDTKGHEGGRRGAGVREKGKLAFLDNGDVIDM